MDFHIAQLNIAKMLYPLDAPEMEDFRSSLDAINALADSSDGFIWRLQDASGDSTGFRIFDDEYLLVNLSLWTDCDHLHRFVYKSAHVSLFKRKKEWFSRMTDMHMVLWYIPAGTVPTVGEAIERLMHLREKGESPLAFSFRRIFRPEDLSASTDPQIGVSFGMPPELGKHVGADGHNA
ncbi:MAG: DUF3291 domain-containing protein [Bacteroidota bacterium]|nr:DUF3291 domain-containing protein [Bacteroidota bacterium]MDP4245360.1 DUF3291 domain-containing protein [Bacteroidota bacterium]MDP4252637.1 DUF3291 domain-containing protein [Bacteroidota bacterium]MDP4258502.1 DUF3291 domain-containing protein [Bacteroidota bacterium]